MLYNEFHHFELIWDESQTTTWRKKHLELLILSGLSHDMLHSLIFNKQILNPRPWLKEFIDYIISSWVQIIIISSWISNMIELFMEYQGIKKENYTIIANELISNKEGKYIQYNENNIITTLNKYKYTQESVNSDKVIILWDDETDTSVYSWNNATSFWFCNNTVIGFNNYLWKDADFYSIIDYIKHIQNS